MSDQEQNNVADLVRQSFFAFLLQDRGAMERLLSDDFTFTSPRDDHLNKEQYFERCFPNSGQFQDHQIEQILVEGNEAFVRYRAELKDGSKFRNTEYFRIEGDKIREIEVFFGATSTK